ncbi:hypothetical protein F4808DRAFT_435796 [Astrocystis sublimbata]|nr:hypothetical protein F4808DRAFT_435796 [Astrocystis sublimbata]
MRAVPVMLLCLRSISRCDASPAMPVRAMHRPYDGLGLTTLSPLGLQRNSSDRYQRRTFVSTVLHDYVSVADGSSRPSSQVFGLQFT